MIGGVAAVGIKIKKRRQVLGMTQDVLAERLGVSKSTVANWERGKHFPLRHLGAVEAVLDISLEEAEPPGPLTDLEPWREPWEEQVAADEGLPVETRRWLITDSRTARVAHAARKQSQRDRSLRDRDREAG